MSSPWDILLALLGGAIVFMVVDSAMRTFVLPRGVVSWLTRVIFRTLGSLFRAITRPMNTYEARDRAMALYAPVALMTLVVVWVLLVMLGFAFIFRAFVFDNWADAFEMSGSSIFTLGFVRPPRGQGEWGYVIAFVEAGTGLALLALFIAFLPTIYSAFSRRELAVSRLAARAGTPPDAVELIIRYHQIGWTERAPAALGRMGGVVLGGIGVAHDVRDAGVLSFAQSAPVVDHLGRRSPRCRCARAVHADGPVVTASRTVHPGGLPRVAGSGDAVPNPV